MTKGQTSYKDNPSVKGNPLVGEVTSKSLPKFIKMNPKDQVNSFNIFGKSEDSIELNIYDTLDNLISHTRDFKQYTFTEEGTQTDGTTTEVVVNPIKDLRNLNLNMGKYKLEYRFQRKKITNSFVRIFSIKEISNSRREIRINTNEFSNIELEQRYNIFNDELSSSSFFKDFTLNFGNGINVPAVNILLDKLGDNYSLLIKLLDPLPLTIANTFTLRIVEDLIQPSIITLNLEALPIEDGTINIAGPNFKIDTRLNSSIPSEFKTYDELLSGGITSSFQNVLNSLSSSFEPNIEYNNLVTDSGYHFENFAHFSSATERLNNFKYKLKLLELYNSQTSNINTIVGDASSSITVLDSKKTIENKKNKLIGGFDGYERFLYYESGTYSWPKSNSTKPYIQYPLTSSQTLTWFGSNDSATSYYGGQIYSSSQFDNQNIYNLNKLIPEYIKNDSNNDQYKLFIDMVGQHFDQSWLYIKSLTENKRAENKLNRGIDKDLVYSALKGLGIKVFDEFENSDIFEYLTGINKDGSLFPITGSGITLISSSNEGSLPKADITKEKWKRIYHNLPYLLKTKGTERGIRALITSYGIPSTILNIKEFGGSTTDATSYKTFNHDKFSYALEGSSSYNNYFIKTGWSGSQEVPTTIKFRAKPYRLESPQLLWSISGSGDGINKDLRLELHPYTGSNDILSFNDKKDYGELKLISGSNILCASTSKFTIFDSDFWDISISSGSNGINFAAYKTIDSSTTVYSSSNNANLSHDVWKVSGSQFIGGANAPSFAYSSYSGSIQHLLMFKNEVLTNETLKKHALTPSMYSGNTISSSYNSLIAKIALGSNLNIPTLSTNLILSSSHPNSNISSYSASLGDITNLNWRGFTETHHLTTPDTVGKSMTSEKVRIDSGEVEDNILSRNIKTETSTLDRQPIDYADLGVYFSPSFEINKDIIYQLGSFRLDDYIGDPTHISKDSYPDLKVLSDEYYKKNIDKFNYTDFINTTKQFDSTLFKMIESMVPAKSNLKTGILIEPHYLERSKIGNPSTLPTLERHNNLNADYDLKYNSENSDFNLTSQYLLIEGVFNYTPESGFMIFDTGSNPLLNNATKGRISNKYFRSITSKTEEF
tara:strand:+ start:2099 stop:5431 length:3333 start_codon:yes stop_codon:yes gene_type:complete